MSSVTKVGSNGPFQNKIVLMLTRSLHRACEWDRVAVQVQDIPPIGASIARKADDVVGVKG